MDNHHVVDDVPSIGPKIADYHPQTDHGEATAMTSDASEGDVAGGLFGSESEADDDRFVTNLYYNTGEHADVSSISQEGSRKPRKLDNEEQDASDDQDKSDLVEGDDGEDGMEERAETVLDVKLGRHAVPRPSDGEVSRPPYCLEIYVELATDPCNRYIFSNVQTF